MNKSSDPNDALEKLVADAVRDLPLRRAPRSLEARVLAEIERRSARSWWQSDFAQWPMAVRMLFIAACVASGVALARAASWLFGGSSTAISEVSSELTPAATSMKATVGALSLVAHSIPVHWIYGALIVMALMYATLFGIGAAAYRTLYPSR